ncbi:MAG: trigger factor [Candidatus Omnitrophota bacterium]
MKTEVKKVDATNVQISVEVLAETVSKKLDEIYGHIAKEARVPGFRPGNAPRAMLEKYHANTARQHLLEELIPEVYQKAVEENKLAVVDAPTISDINLSGLSLSFKAKVEVQPEFKLDKYKGLKLKRKKIEVTKENIEELISKLAEERSTPDKKVYTDDKFAKALGYINLDQMRSSLEKQLYLSFENRAKSDIENQLIQQLLDKTEFSVPASLINRQLKRRLDELKWNLELQGKSKEEIDSVEKEREKELHEIAARDVKLFLILEKIARLENIPHNNENIGQRAIEFLLSEAELEEA